MNIRKHAVAVAGIALLFGASFAFAQQSPKANAQAPGQQMPMSGMVMSNCTGGMSGMQGRMTNNSMGTMMGQRSGMHTKLQKLQATINEAKNATDPAKVKSLLNQAEQELSQFMSQMGMMGNGKGMMMHGGKMMRHMGQQQGSMMKNPPTTNNQQ